MIQKADFEMRTPLVDRLYRHWKGDVYRVIGLALDEPTQQPVVVYREAFAPQPRTWVRTVEAFMEERTLEDGETLVPRFQLLEDAAYRNVAAAIRVAWRASHPGADPDPYVRYELGEWHVRDEYDQLHDVVWDDGQIRFHLHDSPCSLPERSSTMSETQAPRTSCQPPESEKPARPAHRLSEQVAGEVGRAIGQSVREALSGVEDGTAVVVTVTPVVVVLSQCVIAGEV